MNAHASVAVRMCRSGMRLWRAGRVALLLLVLSVAQVTAQSTGTVTGTVRRADNGAPVSGAIIRVIGNPRNALTQSDGAYRLQLPPGRYEIQTVVIGFATGAQSVSVAAGETVTVNFTLEQSAVPVEELVVTGTRGVARTSTDSPVPVDVISAAAIQNSGLIETSQILQRLAPSVNFPRTSIADGTDHTRPVTLRGLAPDQVLVLLNGKRRHSTALVHVNGTVGRGSTSVDMNAIPASAIERVEVLRDGAAAQYGSDAIAGVVNIILKSGERREATTTFGRVQSSEDGRDHRDGQFINLNGTLGALFRQGAYVTVNGEYRDRERTNRAYPDARPQYFAGDERNDDPAVISSWQGDGDATDLAGLLNAGLPFGNGMELYAFGGATRREGQAAGFFRRANDNRTVRAIHPDGFLPEIGSRIWDFSGAGGVRGDVAGWRADLSSVYGGNSFRFSVHNSNNVTMGTSSPTEFYAGTMRFNQWTNNLDLAREFDIGLGSPVNLGVGAEFRLDRYQIEAGEPDSYRDGGVQILDGPAAGAQGALGAQVFPGFRPTDERTETRSNVAGYIDLESNVTSQLLLNVAGRAERYSDFGSTADGKIAARFEPVRGIAVRGAFGTGFRAPSLAQSWFSATSTNFIVVGGVNTPFDVRTFPVATPEARVLGATSLEPEQSRNFSAGVSLEPLSELTITADWYAIDIDDRIVLSGNFTQAGVRQLLEDNGITGVAGGRFFTNAIDTESRGFDIVASYGLLLGNAGLLRFTGGYNQTKTKVTRLADPPAPLAALNLSLLDRVEIGRLEEGQPKNNINLTLNYTVRGLGINLHNQRFGEVTAHNLDAALDQTFDPEWITDLDVSYQLVRRLRISAGANNLFDVYPQEWKDFALGVNGALTTSGIYRYPGGVSPFGFNGRTVYIKLAYR
jgi:iron complex outermembrane recepter protein